MMKLAALTGDINGTLCFSEWRGAVGLFLTVISRGGLATRIGDTVDEICVEFGSFSSPARVPDSWITTAAFDCLFSRNIRNIRSDAVAIVLVKLSVALSIEAFDVLRVLKKDRRHILRGQRARAAIRRTLHRIENCF